MNLGFLDVAMTPKTNITYLWRHQETYKKSKNESKFVLGNYDFCKSQLANHCFLFFVEGVEKAGPKIMKLGRIFFRKTWMCQQYLPKT